MKAINDCFDSIASERLARQDADAALQGNIDAAEGEIDALQTADGQNVKKSGPAQTVTSQIMVPTTATGPKNTSTNTSARPV